MKRIAASDGQFLFWYDLRGLGFFAQFAFALLIFSPILFTGYWVSTKFVDQKSPGHVWIVAIILFALLVYALLIFLKGFIIRLRQTILKGAVLEDLRGKAGAKMVILLTQSTCLGKYREKTVK